MQTVSARASTSNQWVRIAEQAARGEHGDGAEAERDRRRDRRAEDEQEDDQQDRQGDQLAALGGGDRLFLDRPREAWRSRSGWRAPAAWIVFFERAGSSCGTVSLTAVSMSTWKSARIRAWRGLGRRRATAPRSQGESVVTLGSRRRARTSAGPWRSSAAGRALQQDRRTARSVAEVLAQHRVGARGFGAGDVERARAEPAVEPQPEQREQDDRDRQGGQGAPRPPHLSGGRCSV